MRSRLPYAALGFAALALAGCEMAPPYRAPLIETPVAYKEAPGWTVGQPADDQQRGPWWTAFHDDDLNGVEDKVTAANQDLKAAAARYQEARAVARAAKADLYPTLDASASTSSGRLSREVSNPLPNAHYNDDLPKLDVSWEIDVWGRGRRWPCRARGPKRRSPS